MSSYFRTMARASWRFFRAVPASARYVLREVARRRRWQLVATLLVGLVLGAVVATGLQLGHGSGVEADQQAGHPGHHLEMDSRGHGEQDH